MCCAAIAANWNSMRYRNCSRVRDWGDGEPVLPDGRRPLWAPRYLACTRRAHLVESVGFSNARALPRPSTGLFSFTGAKLCHSSGIKSCAWALRPNYLKKTTYGDGPRGSQMGVSRPNASLQPQANQQSDGHDRASESGWPLVCGSATE